MKNNKSYLRKQFILKRKKKYLNPKKFNFQLIFNLINKNFYKKKITIAGYYPANYEVDILGFLKMASKKNYKIILPVIKSNSKMSFKLWIHRDPLYVSKFGILEPHRSSREMLPDLIMVPLVAFDKKLNRIGYGKGYYDRILSKINKKKNKVISVGIANSSQQCKNIPINKYDFKLDYIFTDRGIIN
jgi:5-formyltetrahydrofolate cyclo-ligase